MVEKNGASTLDSLVDEWIIWPSATQKGPDAKEGGGTASLCAWGVVHQRSGNLRPAEAQKARPDNRRPKDAKET